MINRDAIEKALLLGIVRDKNWEVLILNNVERSYFSVANHGIYDYIKDYVDKNEYPELPIIAAQFEIEDSIMQSCLEIDDLDGLCKALKTDYLSHEINHTLGDLNEYMQEVKDDPTKFIQRLETACNKLKLKGQTSKSVSILDNIDEIIEIDPNDVISTGFKELDEKLIGWRRGEDLIVFTARTGTGKSWIGLKFALAAAFQGERVGIYSGEMSLQQLQERVLCCTKPTYTSTREDALNVLKEKNPYIKILTQKELRRKATVDDIEEMIIRDRLTMIVIDQLSLMDDKDRGVPVPIRQQFGNISMDLFFLSGKYNLPCILLAQSNRQANLDPRGPQVENIAESDMVGQNATRVIAMNNQNGILTFNIGKNRYGIDKSIMKYEVDYAINKYKPIKEVSQESNMIKKAKSRQIFGGGVTF